MHVVATAGHVDHGKSALIRTLTGMEPDRLREEKRRGLTIDLGYAWLSFPDGTEVAFVDVPGHDRFVPTMLAGVGPVPAVILVVAADEGWRAQTAEHVAAVDALGVRHGLLVVSRTDLADPAPVIADVRSRLADTSLRNVPVVTASAVTGAGIEDVRVAIRDLVGRLPAAPVDQPVRMWVDRVFTIRGAGTVVTGTLPSGTVGPGDELMLVPQQRTVRVRSVESLGRTRDRVPAVARVGLNLRGVDVRDLARGDALVTDGGWWATDVVDARLVRVKDPLPAAVVLHMGSAAVPARLRHLGHDVVRVRLGRALPLHVGDRGLLRDPSRHGVLAGMTVLDVNPPALTRRGAALRRARQLADSSHAPDADAEVLRRGAVRRTELLAYGYRRPPDTAIAAGEWYVAPATWQEWRQRLLRTIDTDAAKNPLAGGLPAATAARAVELPDASLLARLLSDVPELAEVGGRIRRREGASTLPPAVASVLGPVLERLATAPFAAPEAGELSDAGVLPAHLAVACRLGLLLEVGRGVFIAPDAVTRATDALGKLEQPFTVAEARAALQTTRRVAIPLLELLDRQRVTRRVDDLHRQLIASPTE